MSISVLCSCGKVLKARDEDAGKRAKCPACGSIIVIEAVVRLDVADEPRVPHFQAITFDLGTLSSSGAYLNMSLKIEDNGDAAVMLYVNGAGSRRQGEIIRFRPNEFSNFLVLIEKVRDTILNLQRSGKMSKMIEG